MSATTSAVVTGAARGFGKEIARRLAARGHRVVITDLDADRVAATAAELGVTGVVADVRRAGDHRKAAEAAAELGPVGVWVNNAGVLRAGKAWELSDEDLALHLDVNVLGVVLGSRAAVEAMRSGGRGGHILNIASISAHGPVPGLAVYAASKAAVLSFTTSLQGDLDLARLPIRAHALCPDAADTALVRDEQHHEDTAMLFTQGTLLTPEAVADAAIALVEGRRIVRTVPGARGGLLRFAQLMPSAALPVMARMRVQGDRRRRAT